MTRKSGVEGSSIEGVVTQPTAAVFLASGDEVRLASGEVVTVDDVELYPRNRSMRGRKRPLCRIRVTIPNQGGSSGGSVIAGPGDQFLKLVGVLNK